MEKKAWIFGVRCFSEHEKISYTLVKVRANNSLEAFKKAFKKAQEQEGEQWEPQGMRIVSSKRNT